MTLLIIDPNFSRTSPSMKGVIAALPRLKSSGLRIEAWACHCDSDLPLDSVDPLPAWTQIRFFSGLIFSLMVSWRAWWRFTVRGLPRPDIIYSIAWYLADCDVTHVHFSCFDWEKRQQQLGTHSLRDRLERALNLLHLHHSRHALRRTSARRVICVSEAVAADIHAENPALNLAVLPNCYDPKRFHPEVRDQYRAEMRLRLGFQEDDQVFIFVSAGHYRRKGFFLAIQTLEKLRQHFENVRFLVIGGSAERLNKLQNELGSPRNWITFTGMVPDVERYFAAADAFLFPSYSEAFALVEVEAAACGLPLFLTPHHGSEMILEDGINGRSIPFDPTDAAEVISEFLEGRWQMSHRSLKRAVDQETYATEFTNLILSVPKLSLPTQ